MANGFELPPAGTGAARGVPLGGDDRAGPQRRDAPGTALDRPRPAPDRISEGIAAAATALTFFGGPLIFYSLVGMTHAPAFALAALLLLVLVRQRETGSVRLALAAGAIVGGAVMVRYGSVDLAAPALLAIFWGRPDSDRPDVDRPGLKSRATDGRPWAGTLRRIFAFGAGLILPLLPLPFWWGWLFGSWRPPYGGTWVISAASPWNVLFSPVHGLFLFHPALLLAAVGLVGLGKSRMGRPSVARDFNPGRRWGLLAAVWFLSVAVLYGWWSEWNNAGGYGQRFLIDALPALGLGFAAFLAGGRPRLKGSVAAVAVLFGYLLFFAAVGELVLPPAGLPWPQRLGEYAPLLRNPPGPAEMADALRRASLPVRAASRQAFPR